MANNRRAQIKRRLQKILKHLEEDRNECMGLCELYADEGYPERAAEMMFLVEGYEGMELFLTGVVERA